MPTGYLIRYESLAAVSNPEGSTGAESKWFAHSTPSKTDSSQKDGTVSYQTTLSVPCNREFVQCLPIDYKIWKDI